MVPGLCFFASLLSLLFGPENGSFAYVLLASCHDEGIVVGSLWVLPHAWRLAQ